MLLVSQKERARSSRYATQSEWHRKCVRALRSLPPTKIVITLEHFGCLCFDLGVFEGGSNTMSVPQKSYDEIVDLFACTNSAEILALACFDCNRFKGSDVASIDPLSGELTPLFNPRTQKWHEHFTNEGGRIVPRTAVGRVTELVLKLNLQSRVEVSNACKCRSLS